MKIIRSLKAAAVVPLLLVSQGFSQLIKDDCGTPIMPSPRDLSIQVTKSPKEAGVYVFTPMCGATPCDPSHFLSPGRRPDHSAMRVYRRPSGRFFHG